MAQFIFSIFLLFIEKYYIMQLKGLKNAWLSPKGDIINDHPKFDSHRAWHEDLAQCILSDIWKLPTKHEVYKRCHEKFHCYTYEKLQDMGWIRLHDYSSVLPAKWVIPLDGKLTKYQKETILDWCIANNVRYNDCFSK